MNLLGFLKPKLEPEAFYAYVNRMPDVIGVKWQKDGEYIVGEVDYDNYSFVTQAKNPQEFIEMVNEGVIISNNIPRDYIQGLKQAKSYVPSKDVLEELVQAVPGTSGSWNISKDKKPVFA